jgi:pimeloyl-ACP methyl ester carboxylesterase
MTRPWPDPVSDRAGYLSHSLAFARRIAGQGYPLDEDAHRALVLEEVRRAYDPGDAGRQLAAIAVTGDRRLRLATITAPTLVVHGADDPLILPACGRDTAASIPNAEFRLIDGMGNDLPPALYRTVVKAIDQVARRQGI